jgi:dihydroorotase-like cyclic amidohydrolase
MWFDHQLGRLGASPEAIVPSTDMHVFCRQAGPSITLAAAAETLALALGGFTPMPAVRNFSLVAALAVLLDFFLQVKKREISPQQ